eukprot:755055-Hanusia_phi.AAC.1
MNRSIGLPGSAYLSFPSMPAAEAMRMSAKEMQRKEEELRRLDNEKKMNQKNGHKAPWTPEEDEEVRKLVDKHGDKSWVLVASFLPNRTGKQIRERWHNQLDPNIMKGPWTEEEDMLIMEAQKIHGN